MRNNIRLGVFIMTIVCIALAGCDKRDNEDYEEQSTALKLVKSRTIVNLNTISGEYKETKDIYSYDSNWQMQSIKEYIDGEFNSENTYTYDLKGNIIQCEAVDKSGVVVSLLKYEYYSDGTNKSYERSVQNANGSSYNFYEFFPDGRAKSSYTKNTNTNEYYTIESQSSSTYSYEGETTRCVTESVMKQTGDVSMESESRTCIESTPSLSKSCSYYKNNGEWTLNDSIVSKYDTKGRMTENVRYDSYKNVRSAQQYEYIIAGLMETSNAYRSSDGIEFELMESFSTEYLDSEKQKVKKTIRKSYNTLGGITILETEYTWDGDNSESIMIRDGNIESKSTYIQTDTCKESTSYSYVGGEWVMTYKNTEEYFFVNKF